MFLYTKYVYTFSCKERVFVGNIYMLLILKQMEKVDGMS